MNRRVKYKARIAFLVVAMTAILASLLSLESAAATPSRTLVVKNTSDLSIRISKIKDDGNIDETSVEVPPHDTRSFFNFLNVGYNEVVFEAYCVSPRSVSFQRRFIAQKGGHKVKEIVLSNKNFGSSFMSDRPGCGSGISQDDPCEKGRQAIAATAGGFSKQDFEAMGWKPIGSPNRHCDCEFVCLDPAKGAFKALPRCGCTYDGRAIKGITIQNRWKHNECIAQSCESGRQTIKKDGKGKWLKKEAYYPAEFDTYECLVETPRPQQCIRTSQGN